MDLALASFSCFTCSCFAMTAGALLGLGGGGAAGGGGGGLALVVVRSEGGGLSTTLK